MKRDGFRRAKPAFGRYGGHFRRAHPLREINVFFAELSPIGMELALRLKFGPAREHGSAESLRAWPRGQPGQGTASSMTRPEIAAAIRSLRRYIGASQIARIA